MTIAAGGAASVSVMLMLPAAAVNVWISPPPTGTVPVKVSVVLGGVGAGKIGSVFSLPPLVHAAAARMSVDMAPARTRLMMPPFDDTLLLTCRKSASVRKAG